MVIGCSAKEEHVGKLEVSLFTLALISWALKEEHSETTEQQAGQFYKSFVAPCILSVPFLYFHGFESCPQADTRADKTSNGASDRTFSHLACYLGELEAESRPFVVPHDVPVAILSFVGLQAKIRTANLKVPLLTHDQMGICPQKTDEVVAFMLVEVVVGRYRVQCNNLNLNGLQVGLSAYISNAEKSERQSEPVALCPPSYLPHTHHEAYLHKRISFVFPPLIHEMPKSGIPKRGRVI